MKTGHTTAGFCYSEPADGSNSMCWMPGGATGNKDQNWERCDTAVGPVAGDCPARRQRREETDCETFCAAKSITKTPEPELKKKGLSPGAIAGIVIGSLAVISVIAYFGHNQLKNKASGVQALSGGDRD